MKTLILIPSRLSAVRLPGKPLLKINGLSIISHVYKKAVDANIGEVYVAAEDQEIIDDVNQNGGQAILTSNKHKTGTDRIFEALNILGKSDIELVMNLQGDEPLMNIDDIRNLHSKMIDTKSEIGTLASKILKKEILDNQNIVKVITKENLEISKFPEAIEFLRKPQKIYKNIYHHLGIYAYKPEVLRKLIKFEQSNNEIKDRLEQLRAMENGIKINVALAKFCPIGVDTMEDYLALKKKIRI